MKKMYSNKQTQNMRSKKISRRICFAVDVINLNTPIPPHELLNHLDYSQKVIAISIILLYKLHHTTFIYSNLDTSIAKVPCHS